MMLSYWQLQVKGENQLHTCDSDVSSKAVKDSAAEKGALKQVLLAVFQEPRTSCMNQEMAFLV